MFLSADFRLTSYVRETYMLVALRCQQSHQYVQHPWISEFCWPPPAVAPAEASWRVVRDPRSTNELLNPSCLLNSGEALTQNMVGSWQAAPALTDRALAWSPSWARGVPLFPVMLLCAKSCPELDLGAYMTQFAWWLSGMWTFWLHSFWMAHVVVSTDVLKPCHQLSSLNTQILCISIPRGS